MQLFFKLLVVYLLLNSQRIQRACAGCPGSHKLGDCWGCD